MMLRIAWVVALVVGFPIMFFIGLPYLIFRALDKPCPR